MAEVAFPARSASGAMTVRQNAREPNSGALRRATVARFRLLHVDRTDPRLNGAHSILAMANHPLTAVRKNNSAFYARNVSNSASTARAIGRRAPARQISVSGSSISSFWR